MNRVLIAIVAASFCCVPISSGFAQNDDFKVTRGQLTFDAEGQEGGKYHSRTPHVPSNASGVTIGRGYDLKHRKKTEVIADMVAAGIAQADANAYSGGVGLTGAAARKFIKDSGAKLKEITAAQQKSLFETTYEEIETDVKRICGKADVVKAYGKTDWANLNAAIKDVLIDLRYRGDYTPSSRKLIQEATAQNDYETFREKIVDRSNWSNVPKDRFDRRVKFINASNPHTKFIDKSELADRDAKVRYYVTLVARDKNWSIKDKSYFGHAYVVWEKRTANMTLVDGHEAFGFYPPSYQADFSKVDYEGAIVREVESNTKTRIARLRVRVTKKAYEQSRKTVNLWDSKEIEYKLFSNSCISFTDEVASAIGLTAPSTQAVTPFEYLKGLIKKN